MAQLASVGEKLGKGDDLVGDMCQKLFDLMKRQQNLLTSIGELIIRLVCKRVDAKRFFATAAKTLETMEDKAFARHLVQVLNRGLLTGPETKKFRAQLRSEARGQVSSTSFPMVLMQSWLCCPVSSLVLSFWMNWYELAAELATRLATMPRTEEIEEQLKQFVELLESPVFSDVRLQLLDRRRPALLRAVLRLAALLPQEKALQSRLQVVETGLLLDRVMASRKPMPGRRRSAEARQGITRRGLKQ
ncbi:vac14 [Symbiodinium pilosum]|uniref:Vac14 protein n=1 Tax=Symbiodinium pilosum TaxID=2952 RepID=A0A812LNP3_SYMPI|nr:vac14 [Symbiodinium pilosum]